MHHFLKLWHIAALGISPLLVGMPEVNAATVENDFVSTIVGADNGLCLGVTGSDRAAGARLQSQNCSSSLFQRWKFVSAYENVFTIVNVGSGKCIDVLDGSIANGATLQQWSCADAGHQKWKVSSQGSGQFRIISASREPGVVLQSAHPGGANERWFLNLASASKTEGKADPTIASGARTTGGDGPDNEDITVTKPEQLSAALCSSFSGNRCSDHTRRIIRISGVLDFRHREGPASSEGWMKTAMFHKTLGQCKSTGAQQGETLNGHHACVNTIDGTKKRYRVVFDTARRKGLPIGSNKTVIGVGANSGIKGKGLAVMGASNVIIRNLSITDINDGIVRGADAITLEDAHNVLIADNYISRIGRQHIVTGISELPVTNVIVSGNYLE